MSADDAPLYATADDLFARWPEMAQAVDEESVEAVLADASAMIESMRPFGGEPDGGWSVRQLSIMRAVCCEAARAALGARAEAFGASQMTMSAGPYSQTMAYSAASGALYLTKSQKARLGIGRPAVGFASPWGLAC